MRKILLLEDEESLNKGISLKLTREGYQVYSALTIGEAENIFDNNNLDLVISDITLPDGSGLDFGRFVRDNSNTYLMYLTVLNEEKDFVNGYNTGADDYITKPFSLQILVSKVNAIMKRLDIKNSGCASSDGISLSYKDMKVMKDDKEIFLSKTELLLFQYLISNAGHIVTKEQILEHIWGFDSQFVESNTVNVNISRLKSKLETNAISNIRGLGYIWTAEVSKD